MEAIKLQADSRTLIGKQVKTLRQQNIIPGIIYGHSIEPVAIQFDSKVILETLQHAGTSTMVEVHVEGFEAPYLAIFRDVQHDPIKRSIIHIDLQALNLEETVRVPVSIILIGESPIVRDGGGQVLQTLNEVEIEALPTALIPSIEIDISGLTEIGQSMTVGDIDIPEGVTVLNTPDSLILQVSYAEQPEEELEEEELEAGDVEVIGEGEEEEKEEEK